MSGSDLALEPFRLPASIRERFERVPRGPAEGWLTVIALAMLLVALAWSVDDPAWIGGVDKRTDFLPTIAMLGLLVGFTGAKVGWGRWTTHLIGAAFAALVLPLVAGDLLLGNAVSGLGPAALGARYMAAADAAYRAWHDIAILDRPFTREWPHYVIALGGLVWGTAQYAAYAVFGHRRPLDAVIAVGLALLANMALTSHDQLQLMVLASLGGLLLLTRSHAFEEKSTWIRRRIGDPSAVTSLYLRGGSAFIAAAIIGSLTLTATASSKPLQSLWEGVPQRLVEVVTWLRKVLPVGGASIGTGLVVFGSSAQVQGFWVSNSEVAFTADLPPEADKELYWRVTTYSDFRLNGWDIGDTQAADRGPRVDALTGTSDDAAVAPGRKEITIEVHPDTYRQAVVLSPETVKSVDQRSRLQLTLGSRYFVSLELPDGAPDTYVVDALVPIRGDDPGGLTENRLRAAGTTYPPGMTRFLDVPDDTLGPDSFELIGEIQRLTRTANPYDLVITTRTMLRDSGRFFYDATVQDLPCGALSVVECFVRYKRGYCQYYASTMAMLLRQMGVPTRLVQGFLPGQRDASGHEVVRNSNAHAWVEVYFPGYGWVAFDPTGGGLAQDTPIPSGLPVPVTPKPSLGFVTDNPSATDFGDPSRRPGQSGGGGTTGITGPGPYIAIGILLLISMAGLAYIAWRRGPRRPMEPDVAWRGVLGLARRFGFGPRPAQTVFEFAGALADEVPQVRPELQTVARGKVEVAYGRRLLPDDRLRAIADASRRLRVGLLRLAFRRRRRRRGPRSI